jgi:hypothetical protein
MVAQDVSQFNNPGDAEGKTSSSIFTSTPFRTDGIPTKHVKQEDGPGMNIIESMVNDEEISLKIQKEDICLVEKKKFKANNLFAFGEQDKYTSVFSTDFFAEPSIHKQISAPVARVQNSDKSAKSNSSNESLLSKEIYSHITNGFDTSPQQLDETKFENRKASNST